MADTITIKKDFLPASKVKTAADLIAIYPHDKHWLVLFFSHPECKACTTFKPIWANTIWDVRKEPKYQAWSDCFTFLQLDMSKSKHPLVTLFEMNYGISDYPTVLAFPPASQLAPASGHEICLYGNDNPAFTYSLVALARAHTPLPKAPTPMSSSSSSLLSNLWNAVAASSTSSLVMEEEAQILAMPCSLTYCRKKQQQQ